MALQPDDHVPESPLPTCDVRVITRDGDPYINARDLVAMSATISPLLPEGKERQAGEFIGMAFADLVTMYEAHRGDELGAHGICWKEQA